MSQIIWFRNDCRTADHAPLLEACARAQAQGRGAHGVFLWTPEQWRRHDYGPARQHAWRLALTELDLNLARLGIPLTVIKADTWQDGVRSLVTWLDQQVATDLHFHREFGWDEVNRDRTALAECERAGIAPHVYEDRVILDPATTQTGQGSMYRVFTPFKKSWLAQIERSGLTPPAPVPRPVGSARTPSAPIPATQWSGNRVLPVTESEALRHLDIFSGAMADYDDRRNQPGTDGTSRLSAALAVGAVSLRQCLHMAFNHPEQHRPGVQSWISELIWREFYQYLLYWRPDLARHRPFYERWDRFPWRYDNEALSRWQNGQTGFPLVDAGLRQLAQTGWMHNRIRMVTAMFLVKLMQADWRTGEAWFAHQLMDVDFASNNGGWQWCSATGVDAAPYFRIFNPYTQVKRFDPDGDYIRHWVPELVGVTNRALQRADSELHRYADYPAPILDYSRARQDTLAKFKTL